MKTRMAILGAGVALAVLAGCSSGDGGSKVASISTPPKSGSQAPAAGGNGQTDKAADMDAMRAYAKCMREHGVDMPDPTDGGMMSLPAMTPGDTKLEGATAACKKLLPNGGEVKKPTPEELDKQRQQAKCMREHGVNMSDPTTDGDSQGITIDGGDGSKFEEAAKACGLGIGMSARK
ncbi:hypothetical protein ACFWY9_26815 [Amycolatopsis sp. NPDC059027]|uniref:hypothetical protein n=1 Tax=Amycolatopsis sp. NPDC059027 TaxID=3346709 RepID=UPI00366CDEA4